MWHDEAQNQTKAPQETKVKRKMVREEKYWISFFPLNREKVNSKMVKLESPVTALKRGKSMCHSRANE